MPRNPTQQPRSYWCFTLNNYTSDEYDSIRERAVQHCSYAIIGRETGENGTPHLQGYLRLKEGCSFTHLKSLVLNERCHIEKARGAAGVNRRYCSKDGDYWEHGKCPGREDRKSRDELVREFNKACSEQHIEGIREFADKYPGQFGFFGHVLVRNWGMLQPPIDRPGIHVTWIHGPPGTGKSRSAHAELPAAFIKDPRTKWWNGYILQREVIIDDLGPNGIDLNHLLRWFDRYKCTVETKGGMLPLYADRFIVTSNFHPKEIYCLGEYVNPQLPALLRRIELIEMK